MKAITVQQPPASLIAEGVKWVETRSRPTNIRGRIAIHAAARKPRTEWFRDGGQPMPPWFDLVCMAKHYRWWEDERDGWWDLGGYEWVGPLGAVVATANLTNCVPIVEAQPLKAMCATVNEGDTVRVVQRNDDRLAIVTYTDHSGETDSDITDQLPYGDFAPGMWAYLLDDIEPLSEPVPATGRQGWWEWTP